MTKPKPSSLAGRNRPLGNSRERRARVYRLAPSRKRGTSIVERQAAWHAEWQDCPIAVWMKGEPRAFVIANVPYVSFQQGLFSKWKGWLIVSRASSTLCSIGCFP